jgi:hypothetical protein
MLPLSIGLEVDGGMFKKALYQFQKVPVSNSIRVRPCTVGQKEAKLKFQMGEHIHARKNKRFESIIIKMEDTKVLQVTFDVKDTATLLVTVKDEATDEIIFKDTMKEDMQPDFDYIGKAMEVEFDDIEKEYTKWVEEGRPTKIKENSICSMPGEELDFIKFIESPAFLEMGGGDYPGMDGFGEGGIPDFENMTEDEVIRMLQSQFGDSYFENMMA